MQNWEGVEMMEGSRTGEGEGEGEGELDIHSGFVAVNDQTEREYKRR